MELSDGRACAALLGGCNLLHRRRRRLLAARLMITQILLASISTLRFVNQ